MCVHRTVMLRIHHGCRLNYVPEFHHLIISLSLSCVAATVLYILLPAAFCCLLCRGRAMTMTQLWPQHSTAHCWHGMWQHRPSHSQAGWLGVWVWGVALLQPPPTAMPASRAPCAARPRPRRAAAAVDRPSLPRRTVMRSSTAGEGGSVVHESI
jgi:hypothetical protein